MSDESELQRLGLENAELRLKYDKSIHYIRDKVNQLLTVMGTSALRPEELDDDTLIETDPIGIVSDSFVQILRHLKKTNEKLKFAHNELQAIFDSTGMGILVIDKDLRITGYNKKLKELFFDEAVNIVGQPCHSLICKAGSDKLSCPFKKIFQTSQTVRSTQWALGGRYFDVVGTPLMDAGGVTANVVMVYMDVTESIMSERALRKSEERYRDLFENANDLIQTVGPDGAIMYVNSAWLSTLGYEREDLRELSIFDVLHPECIDCSHDLTSIIHGVRDGRIETSFVTRDQKKIILEGNVSSMLEDGRFTGTRGIFRDITNRKLAEDALAAEREQLLVTLRSIGDGVITTDTEGNIVLINKVAEQLTGWAMRDAAGRRLPEVFNIINQKNRLSITNPVEEVLRTGIISELPKHSILIARDGSERLIADSVAPILDSKSLIIGSVVVFRDITDKQKMEDRIMKSERIESLGVLAGGIAHDFNNLLNAVMGNVDLIETYLPTESPAHESLKRAENALMRARDLTVQLLTFSKGGAPIKKAGSISELIRDSTDFTVRGSNVRPSFNLPDDLWKIEFDEGQISQVVNNIALNAIQAMPDGGQLFISAENFTVPHDGPLGPQGRKYVKLTMRDTGPGIAPEHIDKLFDPYYTTKATGNGLGLASTYSIIKGHDGIIDVESAPGGGATFYIYLPAYFGEVAEAPAKAEPTPDKLGKGRILLMDDDNLVRMTAVAMLQRLGYEVKQTVDGAEAIAAHKEALDSGQPFDALIIDLTIPGGMGGKEAFQLIRQLDPGVKAIVSSGYSSDPIMANYPLYGFAGVLSKPFRMKDMSSAIEAVINKP